MAYILHLTSGQPAISPPPNREFRTPPSGSPQPFMNNAQQGTGYLQGERNGPPLAGKATVTPGTPSPYAVQQPDSPHLDRRYSTLYQHNGSPLHINVDSSGYGLASPIHQYQSQSQIQSPIEPHPRRPPPSNTGNNDPPPSPQQRFRQPTLINGIAPYEYPISASTPLLHYRSSQPLQSPMGAQPPATFASPRSPTDRRASVSVAECPHSSSPTRLSFGVPEQDHRPSSAGSNGGDRLPSGGFSTVAIPPPPTAAQSPIHRYFTLPPHDFRGTPNQYRRPSHHRSPSADNPSTAYSFNGEPPAFSFPQPLHSRRPSTIEEVDHQKDLIRRASSPLLQAFSGSSIMTDPGSPITSSPNTPQAMHRPLSGDGGGTAPEHRRASTPPRPSPAHITAAQQPQQNHTQPPPSPTAPRQNQWQQHRAHMTPQPLTTADTATAYSPESTSSSSTPPQQHYFIMSPTKTTATAWDRERYVPPPRLPTAPAVALSGVPQRGPSTTITTTPQKPNLNSPASAAPSVRSRRQTILVAIDGSVHADAAFDWACANIVTRGDNVVVARVLEEVDIRQKYLADKANGTHFLELELKEYASKLLNHYIPRLQRIAPDITDVAVTSKIKIGVPKDVLCLLANELKAARLVIGTRGAARRSTASISSLLPSSSSPGSVAQHCLERATIPVTSVLLLSSSMISTTAHNDSIYNSSNNNSKASMTAHQKFQLRHGGNRFSGVVVSADEAFYGVV